jgi:hypothetical protein
MKLMIANDGVVGSVDNGISHYIGEPMDYELIDCPPEIEKRLQDNKDPLQFNYLKYKDGEVTIDIPPQDPKVDIIAIG